MFCLMPSCVERSTAAAKACGGQLSGSNSHPYKSLEYSQRSLIRLQLFTGDGEVKIIAKKTDSLIKASRKTRKGRTLDKNLWLDFGPFALRVSAKG